MNGEDRQPSRKTLELMSEIKATMMLLQNNLDNLTEKVDQMREDNSVAHSGLKQELADIKRDNKENYVCFSDFRPVRAIVYGMVGTILTVVLLAIVGLVIIKLK